MPEGDTVFRLSARMDAALAGQIVHRSDFRVPRFATAKLDGRALLAWVPRGKHMLTRFEGGITLHSHLGMDGAWKLGGTTQPWPERSWRIRVALDLESRRALGWQLPVCELLPTAEEHRVVGHLGPDVLGPDWDLERAVANLLREPQRPFAAALLDQRNLAGLGNLYAVELCYLARVHPGTPVALVRGIPQLLTTVKGLLEAGAATGIQATTGDRRPGRTHWVYGRARTVCRRCGTRIAFVDAAGSPSDRDLWWCPRCQPEAGAVRDGPPDAVEA